MNPTQGNRSWIKVWVNEWLEGTTRYQMGDIQRVFWVDLLAMAGRSRFGGIVCSGKDGDRLIGYPLSKFQGLLAEPIDVEATFALFERTGKITMQVSGAGSRQLYVIFITNWERYQSEYERTKKYRSDSATPNATDLLHAKSPSGYTPEPETEPETEPQTEKTKTQSGVAAKTAAPAGALLAQLEKDRKAYHQVHRNGAGSSDFLQALTLFETFWEQYPNKIDRSVSWRVWSRLAATEHVEAIDSLKFWTESGKWDEPRYVPSAKKFLRDRRWKCAADQSGKENLLEQKRRLEAKHGI